jgi:hypothetical protein
MPLQGLTDPTGSTPMNVLAPAVLLDTPVVLGRDLDAMDVLVLNALGEFSGAPPVSMSDLAGAPAALLSMSITAAWAGRNPERAERALLGALAARLVRQLVHVCGDAWHAEAEAVVDLALAARLDELPSLPMAVRAGGVGVDRREAADLLAPAVQHPQTVWLV